MRIALACALLFAAGPGLRAEYIALRSGQGLHATSYQLVGEKYRLQLHGGFVEVPVDEVAAIEPEDMFAPIPVSPPAADKEPFQDIIESVAKRYEMDAGLIASVIAAESNFDPKAVSRRNARGLMQLLPQTAARLGVQNIFDPQENIDAGTRYLRDLLQRYNNDLILALAAYNAGPERVEQFGSVPPYPETTKYVRRVKRAYEKSKSSQTGKDSAAKKTSAPVTPRAKPAADPVPALLGQSP
jgi:soluble lytic murein transglycosylase-like protein